jgi:hypothetical protein
MHRSASFESADLSPIFSTTAKSALRVQPAVHPHPLEPPELRIESGRYLDCRGLGYELNLLEKGPNIGQIEIPKTSAPLDNRRFGKVERSVTRRDRPAPK